MNSGKAILEEQEKPDSIELLAAQRQLYSEAKRWKAIQFAFAFAAPLAVTVVQVFGFLPVDARWCIPVELLLVIATASTSKVVKGKRACAAIIQQAFDAGVYGVKFDNATFDSALARSKAAKHLGRYGDSKLKNWYSCVSADLNAGDAISKCQRMNSSWSKRLAGRYSCVVILLPAALLFAIAAGVVESEMDVMSLVFLFSIVEWIALAAGSSLRSFRAYSKLEGELRSYSLGSVDNIRKVQGFLYEARTNDLLVPDWFYRVFRPRDERAAGFL